ncbi:MAG: DedA family protein [Pseudomonadota bacterium]
MNLDNIVDTLGLPGVVLGTALEGEGVAFLAGVFVHRGVFDYEAAAFAAALGAIITDNVVFGVGRFAGKSRYAQRFLTHHRVVGLRKMMDQHQTKVVLGFRFLYGLKTVAPLMLGSSTIPWWRYALLDAVAVTVWAHLFVGIGYGVGKAIEQYFGKLKPEIHAAIALLIFVVVAAGFWYVVKKRREAKGGVS